MGYVDFLEAMVRITNAYPFSDEEKIDLHNFESRINFLLTRLDARYNDNKIVFERKMNPENEENKHFQPRVVVDEDENDGYDMN